MSQQSFEKFFRDRNKAAAAYVNGDASAVDAIIPHKGEASFHSPGGDSVKGAAEVAKRYGADARHFVAGKSRFEVLQMQVGEDLAFWTGFQVAKVQMKGADEPVDMRIRLTEVFAKKNGEWQMIHRHADMGSPKTS